MRPKQPITSPVAIRGSHSCFCASEPCFAIAVIAREPCTETKVRRPESPASSSAAARPYSTAERPAQPYPCRCMPQQPQLAELGHELDWKHGILIPAGDVRANGLIHESADTGAERLLVVGQERVDVEQVVRGRLCQ